MTDDQTRGFIDAHVHVWTNDLSRYPIAAGYTVEEMTPALYPPAGILHSARANGVDRVVLVQMSYYGFDNSYMLDVIAQQPSVFRGVAFIDSRRPAPEAEMRRLATQGVRGFRLLPDEVSCRLNEDGLTRMFREAEAGRTAMCLLMNPEALPAVDRKCEAFPGACVVIDHLARIGMSGPIQNQDVRALCRLARHTQVHVKLSAFYALGQAKPPHLELLPLIRQVVDAFGPQRLMWGSDCPFGVQHEDYSAGIGLIREAADFLSAEDKDLILRRTAETLFFS